MTTNWPARICAYLARLKAARFTGRVQFMINFNQGGISKVVVGKQVGVNLDRESDYGKGVPTNEPR